MPSVQIDLLEEIGKGEFGRVSTATYRGSKVVVKQLLDGKQDGEAWKAFQREARVVERAKEHPHVVHTYGVSLINNCASLVFEFIPGGSLEELLVLGTAPVLAGTVVGFAADSASGVLHLHKEGILHRDIATRNLLLDSSGRVKGTSINFSKPPLLTPTTPRVCGKFATLVFRF